MNMDNCFDWRLEGERYALHEGRSESLNKKQKTTFTRLNIPSPPGSFWWDGEDNLAQKMRLGSSDGVDTRVTEYIDAHSAAWMEHLHSGCDPATCVVHNSFASERERLCNEYGRLVYASGLMRVARRAAQWADRYPSDAARSLATLAAARAAQEYHLVSCSRECGNCILLYESVRVCAKAVRVGAGSLPGRAYLAGRPERPLLVPSYVCEPPGSYRVVPTAQSVGDCWACWRPSSQRCCAAQGLGPRGDEATGADDVNPLLRTTDATAAPPPTKGVLYMSSAYIAVAVDDVDVSPTAASSSLPVPVVVEQFEALFGEAPVYQETNPTGSFALWASFTMPPFDGQDSGVASAWGGVMFRLRQRRDNRCWTLDEYITDVDKAAILQMVSDHPHMSKFTKMSYPRLCSLLDRIEAAELGTSCALHIETVAGMSPRRSALEEVMRHMRGNSQRVAEHMEDHDSVVRATLTHVVREQALNGSRGSATDTDDVPKGKGQPQKGKGQKPKSKLRKSLEAVAGAVGGHVGRVSAQAVGMPAMSRPFAQVGGALMSNLADYVLNTMGVGAYEQMLSLKGVKSNRGGIRQNVLMNLVHGQPGQFKPNGVTMRFASSDYLGQVDQTTLSASGGFTCVEFLYNPGDGRLFPRCAAFCSGFREFVPEGLVFAFKSLIGPNTTGSLGRIGMAIERDHGAPVPASFDALMRCEGAKQWRSTEDFAFYVECHPSTFTENIYRITTGSMSNTNGESNVQTYPFRIWIGFSIPSSVASAGTTFSLLTSYSAVRLSRPVAPEYVVGSLHFFRSTASAATPLGSSSSEQIGFTTGALSNAYATTTTLYFPNLPVGTFVQVWYRCEGSSTVSLAYPAISVSGLSSVSAVRATGSLTYIANSPPSLATAASGFIEMYYQVTTSYTSVPNIAFGTGGTLPTSYGCEIRAVAAALTPILGTNC